MLNNFIDIKDESDSAKEIDKTNKKGKSKGSKKSKNVMKSI